MDSMNSVDMSMDFSASSEEVSFSVLSEPDFSSSLYVPFSEFSVTDTLLLLILLVLVFRWITDILKGGFSWLI